MSPTQDLPTPRPLPKKGKTEPLPLTSTPEIKESELMMDNKKYTWDGRLYKDEDSALIAALAYKKDKFDVQLVNEEDVYVIYLKRSFLSRIKQVLVRGSARFYYLLTMFNPAHISNKKSERPKVYLRVNYKIINDKKYLWDGQEYQDEGAALNRANNYTKDNFEVRLIREEDKYLLYTWRVEAAATPDK